MAGTMEHAASVDIIEKRCDRVLMIVSPSFLKSKTNTFLTNFTNFVGVHKGRTILCPVMFKKCDSLPAIIQMVSKLKYDPSAPHQMGSFYERLFRTFDVDTSQLKRELLQYPRNIPHKVRDV